jgi:hypothetical protein
LNNKTPATCQRTSPRLKMIPADLNGGSGIRLCRLYPTVAIWDNAALEPQACGCK